MTSRARISVFSYVDAGEADANRWLPSRDSSGKVDIRRHHRHNRPEIDATMDRGSGTTGSWQGDKVFNFQRSTFNILHLPNWQVRHYVLVFDDTYCIKHLLFSNSSRTLSASWSSVKHLLRHPILRASRSRKGANLGLRHCNRSPIGSRRVSHEFIQQWDRSKTARPLVIHKLQQTNVPKTVRIPTSLKQ